MLSVLDDPAIRAQLHAIGVEAYHQMIEHGALGEKVELIRGALVEKMSKSALHTRVVLRLLRWLMGILPTGYSVRPEQPLTLKDSEPEPDLAVVAGDDTGGTDGHPTTAELIIEVCLSSEALDRLKLQLYAEAGVPECWLIFPDRGLLERHTAPVGGGYREVARVTVPATLTSTVFPGIALPPSGLF